MLIRFYISISVTKLTCNGKLIASDITVKGAIIGVPYI